jgi:hypothetical protein
MNCGLGIGQIIPGYLRGPRRSGRPDSRPRWPPGAAILSTPSRPAWKGCTDCLIELTNGYFGAHTPRRGRP